MFIFNQIFSLDNLPVLTDDDSLGDYTSRYIISDKPNIFHIKLWSVLICLLPVSHLAVLMLGDCLAFTQNISSVWQQINWYRRRKHKERRTLRSRSFDFSFPRNVQKVASASTRLLRTNLIPYYMSNNELSTERERFAGRVMANFVQ